MQWSRVIQSMGGCLALAAWLIACHNQPSSNPAPPGPSEPAFTNQTLHLNRAQPKLPTIRLWLGAHEITAEMALSKTEVATGMMFRKSMKEEEGMLFVFPVPHQTAFYMKNTYIPLSAAYIDPEGTILEIHDLTPLDVTPVPSASDQVQFVLEMNQGWFERHGLKEGAYLRTEKGSLQETFFE